MRNVFFGLGLVSILAACGSSAADGVVATNKGTKQELVANVVPNRMLTVEIDGMVCQMGCGASIRAELNATNAIGDCSFDFKEGRETNTATIQFNKDLITADEISEIISEINDGQFTVIESNSFVYEAQDSESADEIESSEGKAEEKPTVNLSSTSGFQMPNLLDIFSNLLTH